MVFGPVFPRVFSPTFDRRAAAAAAASWWLAGGAPTPVAVYQPKGAASLAASYVNLVNPGTYDAAPGLAPTLDANGWTFNGSTQYLTTGVKPAGTWSMIMRCSSVESATKYMAGVSTTNQAFFFLNTAGSMLFYNNTGSTSGIGSGAAFVAGTLAIAGTKAYVNGSVLAGTLPGTAQAVNDITIGRVIGGTYCAFIAQAVAFYDITLTAPQVLAISTAMSLL